MIELDASYFRGVAKAMQKAVGFPDEISRIANQISMHSCDWKFEKEDRCTSRGCQNTYYPEGGDYEGSVDDDDLGWPDPAGDDDEDK